MKYIALLLFSCANFSLHAAVIEDPYQNIQYIQLDNGLQVYLLNNDTAVNTKIELTVAVGTDIETKETYGLSHLVEHMVFRDKRIPHRDFVDYIKEEGASYMNGYTTRYETGYIATIENNKSFWIVEQFAQMLFDKEVALEDLTSEKGAVQTEIGAYQWTDKPIASLASFIAMLTPPQPDIFIDDFSLSEITEQPAYFNQKINNQKFTLSQVMAHYETYYYPANMVLKIAGNFDMVKMQAHVQDHYGSIQKTGIEKAAAPIESPRLNSRPYQMFVEGAYENHGYLGVKYILDDYKKHLVISAYLDNLAIRLQQKLRNDLGHTYSLSAANFNRNKAHIAYIYFDGLHNEFETNIVAVRDAIKHDLTTLSNETIDDALREYKKYYTAIEHDSDSLMELITTAQYLQEEFDTANSSYHIFNTINHQDFRSTLNEIFIDNHHYSYINREYYFFPHDIMVMGVLSLIAMVIAYLKLPFLDKNTACSARKITMSRRISNRFLGFIYIVAIYLFSAFIWSWFKHFFFTYIIGNNAYLFSMDMPYSYIWSVSDIIIGIFLFLFFCRYVFSYTARLAVTKEGFCLIGHRIKTFSKTDISNIQTTPWKMTKAFKTFGNAILFWKPLLKITLNDGEEIYIRHKHARHLKEDLEGHFS